MYTQLLLDLLKELESQDIVPEFLIIRSNYTWYRYDLPNTNKKAFNRLNLTIVDKDTYFKYLNNLNIQGIGVCVNKSINIPQYIISKVELARNGYWWIYK